MSSSTSRVKERARNLTNDTAEELRDLGKATSERLRSVGDETLERSADIATEAARESARAVSDWGQHRYDDAAAWAGESPKRAARWFVVGVSAVGLILTVGWLVRRLRNRDHAEETSGAVDSPSEAAEVDSEGNDSFDQAALAPDDAEHESSDELSKKRARTG